MIEHVYKGLMKLYEKYQDQGLRTRILQCLGAVVSHGMFVLLTQYLQAFCSALSLS